MGTRTQTLVQLTDDLVEGLDRRAARQGVSRSRLIRDILDDALSRDRDAEVSRRIVEGYRAAPQSDGRDAWGDLDTWSEENARRTFAALTKEEQGR